MKSTPQVSVVMSVYNGATALARTIESALTQQGCDLELVVVDDGSTDDSGAVLDEWAGRDTRVRVLHQPNTGLTRALIRGCEQARGEFIARLDVGDLSLPGRLEQQANALKANPEISFVSCGTRFIEPGGAFLYDSGGSGFADEPRSIIDVRQRHGLLDGPSHHGSVMFRADAYRAAGGYRAQFYFGQDWDLWYRLGQCGKFLMLGATLYQATVGVGDISTSNRPMQEQLARLSLEALKLRAAGDSEQRVLEQASRIRPERNARGSAVVRRGNSRGAYFVGECLRKNGDIRRARAYFLRSIGDDPLNVKAWVRLAQTPFSKRRPERQP
jgi:glycosyltransferase involved in cell wall biosynthesis